MSIQIILLQLKNFRFWLTTLFSSAISLTIYQEILTQIWGPESLRVKILSGALLVFLTPVCFYFLESILRPRFANFSKSQKTSIIALSILTPIVLAIATLSKDFMDKTIYFALPDHIVRIEAVTENAKQSAILTGVYTQARGSISFESLEMKGWKRKGDEVILENPRGNQIIWIGKAGDKISLTFKPRNNSSKIKIHWDAFERSYTLVPNAAKDYRISAQFEIPFYANWTMLAITYYLSALFIIFSLSVMLVAFPGLASSRSPKKWAWLAYALPMYCAWTFYLLVFWPGLMSQDSIGIWEQIVTGKFVHAVPVAYTLSLWLVTRLWLSPSIAAFFQIMVLGGILGWSISVMRDLGSPKWLTWLTSFALAISPANSVLSITLWKDILFSAFVVYLTILFLKITITNGAWLNQKSTWLPLGIALILVSLYSRNGFFVSLISLLFVFLFYKKNWRAIFKSTSLFLFVYFLFTGPLYRALNVDSPDKSRRAIIAVQILSTHMEAGTYISPEDKKILMPILSGEYPWPFNCYRNERLFLYSPFNRNYVLEHSREILLVTLRSTLENPAQTLWHFSCQGASVYRIIQEYPNEMRVLGIQTNTYGLKTSSMLPEVYPWLLQFLINLTEARSRGVIWFVWRMPFWMYLSAFGCIIFCIRNKTWKPMLILIPGLATVLPYFIITLGQIFRYIYSMYLIGILFSGYFLIAGNPTPKKKIEKT